MVSHSRIFGCGALAVALAAGLAGCSGQQAAQAPENSSSEALPASVQEAPELSAAYVLVKSTVYMAGADGKDHPSTQTRTLDEHGNVTAVQVEAADELGEEGAQMFGAQDERTTFTLDADGVPTAVESTSDLGYGTGQVDSFSSKDERERHVAYPSGLEEVLFVSNDGLHVVSSRTYPCKLCLEAGKSDALYSFGEDGYIERSDMGLYRGAKYSVEYEWEFAADGKPVACKTRVTKPEVQEADASGSGAADGDGAMAAGDMGALESQEFAVKTDEDGNIVELDNADGTVHAAYEYEKVADPSLRAAQLASMKVVP